MNCLEFRQQILVDPQALRQELVEHADTCAGCANFLAEQRTFEHRLAHAAQVAVPAHLRDRIVLRQTMQRAGHLRRLAYAAGVVAMVLGGLVGLLLWPVPEPIADTVIGHILAEPEHLHEQSVVDARTTSAALQRVGLGLRRELSHVRYADTCPMGRGVGAHLVLAGRRGPITVLVLPDRIGERQIVRRAGFEGVVIPTGYGSLAIVGVAGEELSGYERWLPTAIAQLPETESPSMPKKAAS